MYDQGCACRRDLSPRRTWRLPPTPPEPGPLPPESSASTEVFSFRPGMARPSARPLLCARRYLKAASVRRVGWAVSLRGRHLAGGTGESGSVASPQVLVTCGRFAPEVFQAEHIGYCCEHPEASSRQENSRMSLSFYMAKTTLQLRRRPEPAETGKSNWDRGGTWEGHAPKTNSARSNSTHQTTPPCFSCHPAGKTAARTQTPIDPPPLPLTERAI